MENAEWRMQNGLAQNTRSWCPAGIVHSPLSILHSQRAWGQWLHLLGDLVTPSGVPLLYPLSDRAVRLLPRSLATIGEPLIACAALLCGAFLLT
jgi:hypothetical protein